MILLSLFGTFICSSTCVVSIRQGILMEFEDPEESAGPLPWIKRLTGIFTSPAELFENVRQTEPVNSNWLVPWLLYVIVSVLMMQLILDKPSLRNQLEATIKPQFDQFMEESIQKGQVTPELAEQQYEQFAKPGAPWFTLLSITGTLLGSLVVLFALSYFYQLLGRSAMNATSSYMKVVEVIGLTFFISCVERLVTTVLMFATDSIHASPSLAILISEVDPENIWHLALARINAFTFWDLGVTGIGLSTLFKRDLPKVLVLVFALWLLWTLFTLFTGFDLGTR